MEQCSNTGYISMVKTDLNGITPNETGLTPKDGRKSGRF